MVISARTSPLPPGGLGGEVQAWTVPFGIDPGWSFLTSTELTQQEPTTETQTYNWKESTFKKQLWIIHLLKTPNDYIKVEIKWRFPYGWKISSCRVHTWNQRRWRHFEFLWVPWLAWAFATSLKRWWSV